MTVGIIFAIYNCEEFVDNCLEPWLKLRDSHNLILTCTSGRFKPYQDIGIKDKNQKKHTNIRQKQHKNPNIIHRNQTTNIKKTK